MHDLLAWLMPLTLKFPREHRFVIAQQVQQCGFELQSRLLDARHGVAAATSLRRADACVARLRAHLRLCLDWGLINPKQLEHVAGKLAEIGRLLGAWLKNLSKSESTAA